MAALTDNSASLPFASPPAPDRGTVHMLEIAVARRLERTWHVHLERSASRFACSMPLLRSVNFLSTVLTMYAAPKAGKR